MSKIFAIVISLFLFLSSANAALVGYADGAIDTATGLSWLNISKTLNLSYGQVSSELGAGGAFEGYRFATFDEVTQFYQDAGVQHALVWTDASNNRHSGATYGPLDLSDFFNLIGMTSSVPLAGPGSCSNETAAGNIVNGSASIAHAFCLSPIIPNAVVVDEIDTQVAEGVILNASATTGSWLVAVPIPASGLLMLPALASLSLLRRRQRG